MVQISPLLNRTTAFFSLAAMPSRAGARHEPTFTPSASSSALPRFEQVRLSVRMPGDTRPQRGTRAEQGG